MIPTHLVHTGDDDRQSADAVVRNGHGQENLTSMMRTQLADSGAISDEDIDDGASSGYLRDLDVDE